MNIFINDRSDLNEVVAITHDGYRRTRREDLELATMPRADVVLINGTRSGTEYCLYVKAEGYGGSRWILDILSDAQYLQVELIALKMRENAKNFAPAWKLL